VAKTQKKPAKKAGAKKKAAPRKASRKKAAGKKKAPARKKAVAKKAPGKKSGGGLKELRGRLDRIDRRILEALSDRQASIREVAELKAGDKTRLRDILREEQQLTRLTELGREKGLDSYHVTRIFRQVLEHSVRYQQEFLADRRSGRHGAAERSVTVGYQGAEGAYSHIAAMKHFGPRQVEATYVPYESFQGMLSAVKAGEAHFAMLPIENTTAGSINEAYDLLAKMNLPVTGEEILRIDHCLVGLPEASLNHVRRIYSHPQALAQCSSYLSGLHHCTVESFPDTAMAVKKVRSEKDLSQAAIASEEAANLYGLSVIKRDIANQKGNYTRFVVVAAEAAEYDPRIACKTSLIFATRHEKGALLKCLNVLSGHGLNLTKLESRPRPNVAWEYLFYLDFEGNVARSEVRAALEELTTYTSYLKVLGSYPARTTDQARPAGPRRSLRGANGRAGARGANGRGGPNGAAAGTSAARRARREALREAENKPWRLASRVTRAKDTTIDVGGVVLGGRRPVVAAGPPYVESDKQILACARAARNAGADLLSGGCFGGAGTGEDCEGPGFKGLSMLEAAGRAVGLPVMTGVGDPAEVARVAAQADMLRIGARDMQNAALLRAVGQVDRPVVLERGEMASVDDWLQAAEQILATGNQQVVLCETGIRTLETGTRNTLDLTAVPMVRELTHLPVVVSPSRAGGRRRWVGPMAGASLACGAQGLVLEIHPRPAAAAAGGERALALADFERLMRQLAPRLE
jgi:chorismate mutase/prephenate dehydratase